jgi:hypothetical protein
VPHYGLPIFKENRILFDEKWVTERNKQTIALLIAKQLTEIVIYSQICKAICFFLNNANFLVVW